MWLDFVCKEFAGLWLSRKKMVMVIGKKSSSIPIGTSVPLSLFLKL